MTIPFLSQKSPLRLTQWVLAGGLCLSGVAHAACTGPAGNAGDQVYDTNSNNMVFCDGTYWVSMAGSLAGAGAGGGSGQVQYNSGGGLGGSSALTFSGSTTTASNVSTTNVSVASGNVIMGYEVNTTTFTGSGTIGCTSGKQVIGGGCVCTTGANIVRWSLPNGTTGWSCLCDAAGGANNMYAVCAYIQ